MKDKVAVVTGGARGIGKAICEKLARQGCNVVVSDIDGDGAKTTAKELEALGISAIGVAANVADADQVKAMVKETIDVFGRVDILINNAGITRDSLIMRMSEADWDLVIQINLKGAFLCTKAVIRPMMKQRSGKIINVASVIGRMGNAGQANYAASKAGMIGLTQSTAKEVAARNIQVNAIAPGFIQTEMTQDLGKEVIDAYLESIPAKRAGTPDDVANVTAFLASTASDYVTGQVINIDGGLLIA
ncbi:3-oxoacyl-[acyl-carrier-protein] reductase [bacterium]|nr:3-oxoacyl-[acyl-carrier-protein] reductase [bacterium]